MADDKSTPGSVPALFQEFFDQFRATVENAAKPRAAQQPSPGMPPLPGAFSATQMASITESIATQRRSIEALKTQLTAFDEQLATLEKLLGPLAQWSKSWADLEQGFLNMSPRPGGDK
jgi:hypothetical protein